MKIRRSFAAITIGSALSASTVGCSAWSTPKANQERSLNPATWFKKEFQEPVQIAAIWKHDTLVDPEQGEQSGFGARIYFYNQKSQAIPIEGDLTVHGFVTTPGSRKQSQEQPEKKFTFSAEQLAGQYNPSDLGAAYSIWVPWPGDSGFREEITLVATFKSKQGNVIQAAPTKVFLPGKSRFPDDPALTQDIKQVSYQRRSIPTYDIQPSPQKETTRITTIDVPGNSTLYRDEPQSVSVGGGGSQRSTQNRDQFESPTRRVSSNRSQQLPSVQDNAMQPGDAPTTIFEARSLPPPPYAGSDPK